MTNEEMMEELLTHKRHPDFVFGRLMADVVKSQDELLDALQVLTDWHDPYQTLEGWRYQVAVDATVWRITGGKACTKVGKQSTADGVSAQQ